ncbi:DUF202 domain-containing protein [Mycolicibacterium psychrotolerans]|uniref:DUF202 domain-containing protein n=1 Tax=Mycolicibacterium psychrotolerans TaxID=216929 RepID=A0A7I7MBY2_9MYCO|nr:DUF202 domain-containing protein [Mycolicibacterium psychrotolerans]BBX68889.1 hypothetical protein MPSYJ_23500 [Mycolicibacterium psychrotolerans]
MPAPETAKPGLQAERTLLSWERSSLGLLVGGALMMIRHHGPPVAGRTVLAAVAGLLALMVLGLSYRRSRRIRKEATTVEVPSLEVALLGYGTAAFGFAVAVALALSV